MTDADYLRALYPDRYGVAGVWLKPYCLGHVLLLERIGNPFVSLEREPELDDLRTALAICKRTYPEALKWIGSRFAPLRTPLLFCSHARFLSGVAQFVDYINSSFQHPDCWQGMGRKMGTPFLQSVKLTLMMHLGKTELEALSCPVSLALWDYTACWELKDRMQIVGQQDREAMALAKSLSEKRN
jgi:hypothetical protein